MRLLSKLARPAVALVAALSLAAAGCIKSDEKITIYPDGSGKIQLRTTLLGMMAQMAKMGGQMGGPGGPGGAGGGMGGAPQDPFEVLKKSVEGKVYWTNLKAEDGPQGEYMLSGTGYFEDVNQLKRENGSMSFKKNEAGDGYVFAMKGQMPEELTGGAAPGADGKLTPEQEQMQKQMLEMMKGMITGFDMKVTVTMPGQVTSAEGMKAGEGREGREAIFALGEKDLLAIMEKKQEPPKEMKVNSKLGDEKYINDELTAFKKELADAKAASEKEAAEKAAKKPEKKPEPATGGEKPPAGGETKPPAGDKGEKPQDF
jgi:hypothetical protein